MKHRKSTKAVLFCSLVILVLLSTQVAAQVAARPARSGIWRLYGDWDIKVQFGERQMNSILAFSRDNEGNVTGQWISFWGLTDLKDVKFEENKLSFTQVVQFGDNEFTSNFTGQIEDANLAGTLSSDRGESKVEGKRSRRIPGAVGNWEIKFTMGEREITSTLIIKLDKEGNLTAEWPSERIESQITDLQYERGKLTFTRKGKMEDRQWESTFDGTIRGDALSGVIKSQRGEINAEGTRLGAPLIGNWDLEIASERGPRKQRLKVNPDMSGLYGAIPVKKVNLEDDKVSFNLVLEFGERKFEMSFEGKMADSKLTGELTTSRGTQKVTGKKVVRAFRRRTTPTTP
jgi:hypothetical protein